MKTYFVKTQDVDHNGPARKYAKLENAVARFLEMAGGSIDGWIAEQYHYVADKGQPLPKIEELKRLRAVSMYGTVVTFWVEEKTDEELADEKMAREWNATSRRIRAENKAAKAAAKVAIAEHQEKAAALRRAIASCSDEHLQKVMRADIGYHWAEVARLKQL